MPLGQEPPKPLNLAPRTPAPVVGNDGTVMFARVVVAAGLVAVGWWWTGRGNWKGESYCERHEVEFCDGPGFETLAPAFLWGVSIAASVMFIVLGVVTAPAATRARAAWAGLSGLVVFTANRHSLVWAAVITAVAVWSIASSKEATR